MDAVPFSAEKSLPPSVSRLIACCQLVASSDQQIAVRIGIDHQVLTRFSCKLGERHLSDQLGSSILFKARNDVTVFANQTDGCHVPFWASFGKAEL